MVKLKPTSVIYLLTAVLTSAPVAAALFGGAGAPEVSGGAILARSLPPTPLPMIMPPQIQQPPPSLNLQTVPSLKPSLPDLQPLPKIERREPARAQPAVPATPARPVAPKQ